jgi:hypothetical protein
VLPNVLKIAIAQPEPSCQEDEPCWNCHVDGNKICGSDLVAAPVADTTATDTIAAPEPVETQAVYVAPVIVPAPAPVAHTTKPVTAPVAAPQPVKAQTPAPVAVQPVQAQPVIVATSTETADHTCTGQEQPGMCNMAGGPGLTIPTHAVQTKTCVQTDQLYLDGHTNSYCY